MGSHRYIPREDYEVRRPTQGVGGYVHVVVAGAWGQEMVPEGVYIETCLLASTHITNWKDFQLVASLYWEKTREN
jgi:hypothetical protein